jgi:transcriptional regulator with XRE-family HTH domain
MELQTMKKQSSIPEEIKRIRLAKDLLQCEFAKLIGVSRVSASHYECGHTKPGLRTIRKIKEFARLHKIDYDEEAFKI